MLSHCTSLVPDCSTALLLYCSGTLMPYFYTVIRFWRFTVLLLYIKALHQRNWIFVLSVTVSLHCLEFWPRPLACITKKIPFLWLLRWTVLLFLNNYLECRIFILHFFQAIYAPQRFWKYMLSAKCLPSQLDFFKQAGYQPKLKNNEMWDDKGQPVSVNF